MPANRIHINRLDMINYKKFIKAAVSFEPSITVISGKNGAGKSGTPAKSCVKNFRDREKTRILAFTERCKYERDPVYYFGTVYSAAGV